MGIKCEVCGSTDIIKQEGFFTCQLCGIRYSLDEIRKMLQNNQEDTDGDEEKNKKVDDEKYRDFKDRRILLQEGDLVFFGNYPLFADDDTKYPINWIVAEAKDGHFLLLSKYLIDLVQYNTYEKPRTDIPPIVDSKNKYRYVWHNSSLREWLNSVFLKEAFDEDEQEAIIPQTLTFPEHSFEDDMPEYGIKKTFTAEALPDTVDKVFIPSNEDGHIPYKLCLQTEEKTPYAQSKNTELVYESNRQFWSRTQTFFTENNTAELLGFGFLGGMSYLSGTPATVYAYLRPMVLVDQEFIYRNINSYSESFLNYYLEQLNKQREENEKVREERTRKA